MMTSSINDKPISKKAEDRLQISSYVDALSTFILEGETPLTIGLQGEWGTGKTSMMNLIREQIIEEQVPTCWLNTWEHSLFTDPVETTPKLLRAMMNNLKNDNSTNEFVDENKTSKISDVGKKLATIANQALIKKTGVNLKEAFEDNEDFEDHRNEISALKSDVKEVLHDYITSTKNKHHRIVFFIDDLDRIEPSRAVEILEALKNLLDFDGCVFVLAIDYEVVVSGLKLKFGERKDKNDREFRSFFDKIIQVPFHIPTDKYEIENFLEEKFNSFGTIEFGDQFIKDCAFFVKNTLGMNPRALKRQLNLYNLSSRILKSDLENEDESHQESNLANDNPNKQIIELALFALICVQVAYDDLFKAIIAKVDDLGVFNPNGKFMKEFWQDPKHELLLKFKTEIESILEKFEEKKWLKQESALADALSYAAVTSVGVVPLRDKKARSEISLEEHFEANKVPKSQQNLISKFSKFAETLKHPLTIKATDKQLSFYDHKNRDKKSGVICYLHRKKHGLTLGLKGDKNQDGSSNEKLMNLAVQLKNMGLDNARFELDSKQISSLKIDISDQVLEKQSEQLARALTEHKEIYAAKGWYKWSGNVE